MNKDLLKIFNIILQLKGIKKVKYELEREDVITIYRYWKLYDLYKHLTYKKFRNAVVNYSVISGKTLHRSCEDLCRKINFN